ncbi:helix-turn-helix transcriptional regulator [Sphingobacterium siyangense]|uniref:helix-turn-helix transcriptional regulator n=1 Tax=Sphingobacterium siyangense TaxID=459529 RepID=UPI003DA341E8
MERKEINTKRAFEYYCKGLNSKEIAKLLDCSYRTVQNYMSAENWKERRKIGKGK